MKLVGKVLFFFLAAILLTVVLFSVGSILGIKISIANLLFLDKVFEILQDKLFILILIAIAATNIKNEERSYKYYFLMFVGANLTLYIINNIFFDLEFINKYFSIYNMFELEFTILLIILSLKIKNSISTSLYYMTNGAFIILCAVKIFIIVKLLTDINFNFNYLLKDKYTYSSFYMPSSQFYRLMLSLSFWGSLLMYISNFAFDSSYIVDENTLDITELKEKARALNEERQKQMFQGSKKEVVYDKPDAGGMNINNQLGYGANVGAVKDQAKEVNITNTSLNSVFNMSSGPVVNESATPAVNQVPTENTIDNNENKSS